MALKFVCDNCGSEFPAIIGLRGIKVEEHIIADESDPCPACIEESEKAKQEALDKRKQKA